MENRPVDPGSIQGSHRPISFIRIKHRTDANDLLVVFFCETEYLVLRQYDTRYVLCTRYVCTWYQPAEIYTYVRGGTHDAYVPPVDAHV